MVEQGAAGVDHQRVTELLAKYLMGMPDQQHIMPESQQVLSPANLSRLDEIALDIQQPDATPHRIGRTGMHLHMARDDDEDIRRSFSHRRQLSGNSG